MTLTVAEDTCPNLTPIQKFYSGSRILITGGTGFIGRILIEKLLRSCPDLSKIYVLVRAKKGKDFQTRLDELFQDVVFQPLAKRHPDFRDKVVAVEGDCMCQELGLSIQDREILINQVSVIFHVAATVRFDEMLRKAANINVRSSLDLVNLAHHMTNLKAFIHVSTAYSNSPKINIEEKFYPSPIDSKKFINLVDSLSDKVLDEITPVIIKEWPNTYTYTKAIAEDVVRREGHNLPLAVVRPSIVISSYQEPLTGWVNNMYGPTGVLAGASLGIIHTIQGDINLNANLVPVDMCVNSLIVTAWEVADIFENTKNQSIPYVVPIYHYESSNDNPVNYRTFLNLSVRYGLPFPSSKAVWYYSFKMNNNIFMYYCYRFFLHTLTGFLIDAVLICLGKPPRMLKLYKKVHKLSAVISHFTTSSYTFSSKRVQDLVKRMITEDQKIFFCDLTKLDWDVFFQNYYKGIRVYLLEDPLDTVVEATVKWKKLYWFNQCVKCSALLVLIGIIWWLARAIFNMTC